MPVRAEKDTAITPASFPEFFLAAEKSPPKTIIYAGESHRRIKFLEHCFPNSRIISFHAGNEDNNLDTPQIVAGKLDYVLSRGLDCTSKEKRKDTIIIAADVKIDTFSQNDYGIPALKNRGKPRNLGDVREVFVDMLRAAEISGHRAYYNINAASGTRTFSNSIKDIKKHTCYIALDNKVISHFSTSTGFNKYYNEVQNFLNGPDYIQNGVDHLAKLTDLSGGLELAVLAKLGAVLEVDEVSKDDPDFNRYLRYAIFRAAVGFDAQVIKPYQPQVNDKIDQWPWLQRVTAYALNK